jgi:hypothetical protein
MHSSHADTPELLGNDAHASKRDQAGKDSPAQVHVLEKCAAESKNTRLPSNRNADAGVTSVCARLQHPCSRPRHQRLHRALVNRPILTNRLPTPLLATHHNPYIDRQNGKHHHTQLALRP